MPSPDAATAYERPTYHALPFPVESGTIVIERYTYARIDGSPGVQWLVHRIEPDGSASNYKNFDTRREAAEFVAGGLRLGR